MVSIRTAWAAAIAVALGVSGPAAAATGGSYDSYADVVAVAPRYSWHEVDEPVRYCDLVTAPPAYARFRYRDYDAPRHEDPGVAGLIGGLIGGLVGHQFGSGHGRTALTVAGAALGASIASDHARYREAPYRGDDGYGYDGPTVRRCSETHRTRQVREADGYDVTYRYRGRTFQRWLPDHPGDRLPVHVDVEPAP